MPDVFLSYSREDQPTARRFADGLQREGFSVWWDQALDAGESFDKVTEQALRDAKAVVVLWSKHAVDSRWVRAEATQAERLGKFVPVTIEACERPIMFELTHTADLERWNGDAADPRWRAFVEGLRRSVGKTGASPMAAIQQRPRPHPAIAWSAVAAAALLAGGLFWYFQGGDAKTPASAADSTSETTPATLASIAVLPFRDMSPNKDQEYFADGITEEILNSLASLKDLKVTARTSAFAFKGKDVDLREVGQTLGVQHILEGSVRKDGEQLRITAQLIDAKSDAHLWSETYDRSVKDVFAVQEDIARSVAEALQISLGVGIGGRPGMTRDVEAYEPFLQAIAAGAQFNAENLRRMIELLQQAVAKDPTFALAWLILSDAYFSSGLLSRQADLQSLQSRSDAAMKEAQRLQPDLPEAFESLAQRSLSAGRWKEAMGHLEQFESAAAKYGTPDDLKGRLLLQVGRVREALPLLEAYKARDPLNPAPSTPLILAYSFNGNRAAAYSELGKIYGPGHEPPTTSARQAALMLALNMRDEDLLRGAIEDGIVSDARQNVRFYASIKERLDEPEKLKAYMRALVNEQSGAPGLIGAGWFLSYLGEPETALEAYRLLGIRTNTVVAAPVWGPMAAEMRALPAFKQHVRDSGLVDYWREYGWGDFCKPTTGDDFECH